MGQGSQSMASFVNTVMKILVPRKAGISQLTDGLSTRVLLHGTSFG